MTLLNFHKANYVIDFFDWIDDSLLALNIVHNSSEIEESDWIDDHFRESLAYIQAREEGDNVIKMLKARSTAVKRLAGEPEQWKSFASSGIPLMSIAKIDELMDEILLISTTYLDSEKQIENKIAFLKSIESIVEQLPSSHFRHDFTQQDIDTIRPIWLNGDSLKQLLARSRYLLFKKESLWTASQKQRAEILFREYPDIKKAYYLSMQLGLIYHQAKTKDVALTRLARWYDQVDKSGFLSFGTIARTIQSHYLNIINFFDKRSTNAASESFNAKIKAFREQFRGVRDKAFFLFRLSKLFA